MMTKREFEKNHLIPLSKVLDRAAKFNIPPQEALWQLIDDAYEVYRDEEFNREFDAEVNS